MAVIKKNYCNTNIDHVMMPPTNLFRTQTHTRTRKHKQIPSDLFAFIRVCTLHVYKFQKRQNVSLPEDNDISIKIQFTLYTHAL